MSTPIPNERATRTVALAKCLVDAANALDREDWVLCQAHCARGSWEARMLHLLKKRETQESAEGAD